MRVMLLGTGAGRAADDRYNASNVVWLGEEPVLVDVGNGALRRMRQAGIYPAQIRRGFLTHLHYDHYADYGYLAIESLIGDRAAVENVMWTDARRRTRTA